MWISGRSAFPKNMLGRFSCGLNSLFCSFRIEVGHQYRTVRQVHMDQVLWNMKTGQCGCSYAARLQELKRATAERSTWLLGTREDRIRRILIAFLFSLPNLARFSSGCDYWSQVSPNGQSAPFPASLVQTVRCLALEKPNRAYDSMTCPLHELFR